MMTPDLPAVSLQEYLDVGSSAIPAAASSPYALIAYLAAIIAWLLVSLKVRRNQLVLSNLTKLPKADRLKALQFEMGSVHLKSGLSPEQWIRSRIHFYYLIAFAILAVTAVIVFAIAALMYQKDGKVEVDVSLYQPVSGPRQDIRTAFPGEEFSDRTVQYSYQRLPDRIRVFPVVPYLSRLTSGEPLQGISSGKMALFVGEIFPSLSIKVVNNTDETVLITEAAIEVKSSKLNLEPVIVVRVGTSTDIYFMNNGWGKVIDPRVTYTIYKTGSDELPPHCMDPRLELLQRFLAILV